MPALRFVITGLVQGVFFRAHAKAEADRLGLCGWVRNLDDGSLEAHAEGPDNALKEFQEWCQHGPPCAEVEKVRSEEVSEGGCMGFEIMR